MGVKVEAFLDIENSLIKVLEPQWAKIQARIDPPIIKAIEDRNLAKVDEVLETIKPELIYRGKLAKIELLFKTALAFGATLANNADAADLKIFEEKEAAEIVPVALNQFKIQIDQITKLVKRRYSDTATKSMDRLDYEAQQAQEFTKGAVAVQKINPINIGEVVAGTGATAGKTSLGVASSLQMSRLSGYGFASEARARGITTYRVNEQLDSATCPVCRTMNGKEFQVTDALRKLDTQIRLTDPDDIKLLAPFPRKDATSIKELGTLSNEELRARGFDTPPYHPNCRGLLAVARTQVQDEDVPPAALNRLITGQAPKRPFTSAADHYNAANIEVTEAAIVEGIGGNAANAIRGFEEQLKGVIPTFDRYFDKATNKWSAERVKKHDEIIRDILNPSAIRKAQVIPGQQPTYVVLGGRGGSGKSWLTGKDGPVNGNKFLVLDSDEIKKRLDEFKGWNAAEVHQESSYLFDKISDMAAELNLNIVHDMTLKSAGSALRRMELFEKKGYNIEGYYMFLPRHKAAERAVSRALGETKRYVPLEIILSNTKNEQVFDTLRARFSKWGMWDNDVPKGSPPEIVGASFVT